MKQKTAAQCAYDLFGVRVTHEGGRLKKPGWFDVGQTVCACPKCGCPLWGLRAPYISANKTFYYWALICRECKTAITPVHLSDEQRKLLYASSAHRPVEETEAESHKNIGRLACESFLMFNKLQKYGNEIRSFFVQIQSIKKTIDPYIIGDGESWLKEIESRDISRCNKDVVDRIAGIFIEWSVDCLVFLQDPEATKVVKNFQLALTGDPPKSLTFLRSMNKSSNHQMLINMAALST